MALNSLKPTLHWELRAICHANDRLLSSSRHIVFECAIEVFLIVLIRDVEIMIVACFDSQLLSSDHE